MAPDASAADHDTQGQGTGALRQASNIQQGGHEKTADAALVVLGEWQWRGKHSQRCPLTRVPRCQAFESSSFQAVDLPDGQAESCIYRDIGPEGSCYLRY